MSKKDIKRKVMRISLLGDSGVGKTCIINKYLFDQFSETHNSSVGIEKIDKKVKMNDGNELKVIIWDTAGQERFKAMSTNTVKGSQGIVLVFDITKKTTFESLPEWIKETKNIKDNIPIVLFGNKCDLLEESVVDNDEAMKFAKDNDMDYFETSAKQNINIEQGLKNIIDKAYETAQEEDGLDLKKPQKKKNLNAELQDRVQNSLYFI
jgi:small GTP-binding protein